MDLSVTMSLPIYSHPKVIWDLQGQWDEGRQSSWPTLPSFVFRKGWRIWGCPRFVGSWLSGELCGLSLKHFLPIYSLPKLIWDLQGQWDDGGRAHGQRCPPSSSPKDGGFWGVPSFVGSWLSGAHRGSLSDDVTPHFFSPRSNLGSPGSMG